MAVVAPERHAAVAATQVALARQPVVDLDGEVVGYELLWRSPSGEPPGAGHDGDAATAATVLAAVADVGLDALVGDRLAFLNVTRAFLVGDLPLDLDPARVVLEILESVEVTPELVAGVARLAAGGFLLALDDFVWVPGCEALLEYVWAVKLDVRSMDAATFAATASRLAEHSVVLLAEKVETPQEAAAAAAAGCTLAQGWFYARPELVRSAAVSAGAAAALRLMSTLSGPDVAMGEVVRAVGEQPSLSLRVLRLAGSAAGGRRQVRSLSSAVSVVGLAQLERWVLLAALAEQGDVEAEALSDLMVPARMCELLADAYGVEPAEAFLVGLLASLARLLQGPLAGHLSSFGLCDDVVAAVLEGDGPLGRLLGDVRAWVAGEPVVAAGGAEVFAVTWGRALGWSTARAAELVG